MASSFRPNDQEDNGGVLISYNLSHIPAASVKASNFILLPSRPPTASEDFNFAFLEGCGFLIFAWKSTLRDLSFLQYVGRYGETAGAAVSERIQCATPEFFIVAAGDLLVRCHQLAAVVDRSNSSVRSQRQLNSTVTGSAPGGVEEEASSDVGRKRPREQEVTQGERSWVTLYDLDGTGHQSRLKTDITSREAELGVVFRVTEPGRWQSLMGKDFVLQVSLCNDIVVEQAMVSSGVRQAAFISCGLLDRIYLLGFQTDSARLRQLLTGQFGGSAVGALSIQDFLGKDVQLPREDFPDGESNRILATAIRNMEIVLAVYYSPAFIGSLAEFVECLQGVERPMDLAPSGFLGVEMVLTKYFRTLRSEALPERLARNPGECAGLLKKDMADFVLLASHQGTLSEAVARYNKYSRHNGKKQIRPERRSDSPAVKTEGEAPVLGVCINFFGGQLKIENPRTGKQYECTRPAGECPFRHQRSNGMTKTAMLAVVGKFPVQPRGYFEKAIASLPRE